MSSTSTHEPPLSVMLVGATGLVGGSLLKLLIADPRVAHIHVLLRHAAADVSHHPKLHVQQVDFRHLPAIPPIDEAYVCLGTTIKTAGSQAAFREVDLDFVLASARAARAASATRLGVVSSLGADARSAVFYNRVKGEMESAVTDVGFDKLVLLRPSLLLGDRKRLGQPLRWGESIAQRVAGPLAPLIPARVRPIPALTVARAMLRTVRHGPSGKQVLESADLFKLGHS